jgi:hypothetical protein
MNFKDTYELAAALPGKKLQAKLQLDLLRDCLWHLQLNHQDNDVEAARVALSERLARYLNQ